MLQKPLLKTYTPFEVVSYAIWLGTAGLMIFLPGLGTTLQTAPLSATGAVIYLGLFPAALAYFTWSYALSQIDASKASVFLYVVPVVSILIAYGWLGEVPTRMTLVGGALALAGVIWVTRIGKAGRATKAKATVSPATADGRS